MIGKCKICNNYKNDWCEKVVDSPDPDILRDCRYFSHMTNADRIRAMNDEELAWELLLWRFDAFAKAKGDEATLPSSQKTIVDWLKHPVKEDNDGTAL